MARYRPPFAPLRSLALVVCLALVACNGRDASLPGDAADHRPWQGIAPEDTIRFAGNEPFWGGNVTGKDMLYTTPDNPEGTTIAVRRFAGRGGLSFSGELASREGGESREVVLAVTPGACSDTMSDRTYPFVATLQLGDALRRGCAWTDAQPYSGGEN